MSSQIYQWKPFPFFEKTAMDSAADAFKDWEITASTCGRGHLVFGDVEGVIRIFDRGFGHDSFQAFTSPVTHLKQLRSANVLVGIGEDQGGTMKIWSLEKQDAKGNPQTLKTVKLFHGSNSLKKFHEQNARITTFDITEDANFAAFGLSNGAILYMRGDILHSRSIKVNALVRQDEPEKEVGKPVNFVGFRKSSSGGSSFALFTVYHQSTWIWKFNQKNPQAEELAPMSAPTACCTMSEEGELVVAKNDFVYFFMEEGRGSCFAFEGEKRKILWFRSYLLVVSTAEQPNRYQCFIYDLKNKLKVFSGEKAQFSSVSQILSDWGSVFILTEARTETGTTRQVYMLEEKDMQTKLEMLFKRSMYTHAIQMATSQQFDQQSIGEIFKKYADHLYKEGDYEQAVAQYSRTIGKLEPSYVIRKFLDAQRIHDLTKYLEELHRHRVANADHTTLLINCHTKLKDEEKLDKLINNSGSEEEKAKGNSFEYDVQTAIRVCREACYYKHALALAEKHKEYHWYLKIQLENIKDYAKALEFIQQLDLEEAEEALQAYGKTLVGCLPDEATEVMCRVCTDWPNRSKKGGPRNSQPHLFIKAFVDAPFYLLKFLECMVENNVAVADMDEAPGKNHIVMNTLLELYLTKRLRKGVSDTSTDWTAEQEADWDRRKTLALNKVLKDPNGLGYDDEHALVLVQTNNFREGILYLYEKLHLYQDILAYYMQSHDHENLIDACKRYGRNDPNMWIEVLKYFTQDENVSEDTIKLVLTHIERESLLSPLLVLQIFEQSEHTKLSTIRDYIMNRFETDKTEIEKNDTQIGKFQASIGKKASELKEMQNSPIQFQHLRCSQCGSGLTLPARHFLCTHSFHDRCLGENEEECLLCSQEIKKVYTVKKSLEDSVEAHDTFFSQLEEAPDSFTVVAEYFGRGIFNKEYDPPAQDSDDEDSS